MSNIALLLHAATGAAASDPAVADSGVRTTYGELSARSASVAAALRARGLAPGDRVALFLERTAEAAACFFGVVAAGGAAVFVNETLRPRQVEYILEHSGARFLVSTRELLERQARRLALGDTIELLDVADLMTAEDGARSALEESDIVARGDQDLAQLVYTSGSTGMPKGVAIAHGNLWAGMRAVTTYLEIEATDRIASLLPFSFDYGFNQLLCAVGKGACLVIERSPMASTIARTLEEEGVTVLPALPPLWVQLLATPAFTSHPLAALRCMTNTGGVLPVPVVRHLREAQPSAKLFLMYGLTEAFRATYLPPEEADRRPDSIGIAIPGAEILVLRDDLTLCDAGEEGELVQRGPTVALGYWNDPEATAARFRPDPFASTGTEAGRVVFSGDVVRRDEQGFLYFVGRRDRMIKTLGYRVSPDEVAAVLYDSGLVVEAVVTAEPDEKRGALLVAHVVLHPEGDVAGLEAYCRTELPRYLQPARYVVHDTLPRTASGKHDARALAGRVDV